MNGDGGQYYKEKLKARGFETMDLQEQKNRDIYHYLVVNSDSDFDEKKALEFQDFAFRCSVALKHIDRAGTKDDPVLEIEKAHNYLTRALFGQWFDKKLYLDAVKLRDGDEVPFFAEPTIETVSAPENGKPFSIVEYIDATISLVENFRGGKPREIPLFKEQIEQFKEEVSLSNLSLEISFVDNEHFEYKGVKLKQVVCFAD